MTHSNKPLLLDKEIDEEIFSSLRNKVSKYYLLKHKQLGEGIGVTFAFENKYFGDLI